MNSRDFELIALSHVLTRYRLTGGLPNINGAPFSLDTFKQKISQGVNTDSDININIDSLTTESNVTIVENECHEDHQTGQTAPTASTVSTADNENENISDPEEKLSQAPMSPSGRLFQYFNRDKS